MGRLSPSEFLQRISSLNLSAKERAIALLYHAGAEDPALGLSARQIDDISHSAGYARQNVSRLDGALRVDRRSVRVGQDGWRLSPQARTQLAEKFGFVDRTPVPVTCDSVLPISLFAGTRGYLERVVHQINGAFDYKLFDCCAVMCRRLLETLLIEAYEKLDRAAEIKGPDGHFLMLNGLISVAEGDSQLGLSRNGLKGLKDFKTLGDLSAHNRRYNAHASDIDRIRDGLRICSEELLHLSGLHQSTRAKGSA